MQETNMGWWLAVKSEEIAKITGVSRSTISRVINNYPNVNEETRKKVLDVIARYEYTPNTSARTLAGKPHNTVGLFILSISEKNVSHHVYQNTYFAPYLELIVDTLNAKGYFVLVNIIYSEKDYARMKNIFLQKRVDGGIVIGTENALPEFGDILKRGYPLAIVDMDPEEVHQFHSGAENLTILNSANYEGSCEAMEYLIGLGHRDIGLISGRTSTNSGRERNKAYMDTMTKHGLPIRHEFIMTGQFLKHIAAQEVHRMLDRGVLPTAIFSTSDEMALTALQVFQSRGIRVPEDISLIGFDDIATVSRVTPALTTLRVPFSDMATAAVDSIVNAIESDNREQTSLRIPVQLVLRDSCAPPANK